MLAEEWGPPHYDGFGNLTAANDLKYSYDSSTLLPISETLPVGGTTRTITRKRDSLLRDTGFVLTNGTGSEFESTWTYDGAGRPASVSALGQTFTYGWDPERAGLLASVTGPNIKTQNVYDPNRPVLSSKINRVAGTVVSQYDYTVNSLGQRTQIAQNGTAFVLGSGTGFKLFGYDSLGQVTSANRFAGGTPDAPKNPVTGWQASFNYDSIGNRNWASLDTTGTTSYVKNLLNQYKSVSGTELNYDADGNLLTDGKCMYKWDGENRLITVTTGSTTTTNSYDSLSRRVRKTVSGAVSSDTGFVYDGWNLVGEYNVSGSTVSVSALNTWGLDLSNSQQDAGGVGGLLARSVGGNNYSVSFECNGNVSELIDGDGTVAQHSEYGAFGELKTVYDPNRLNNSFGFSTKYSDDESGLVYYGYRFYQPGVGRWINRDPGEESDGPNSYAFVKNAPLMLFDSNGLQSRAPGLTPITLGVNDPNASKFGPAYQKNTTRMQYH